MKKLLFLCLLWTSFSLSADWSDHVSGEMKYKRWAPPATEESRPLLITLHGCAQTPAELVKNGNLTAAAKKHQAVVVLPEVPNQGVYVGCWDYYGENHQRDQRHHAPLINLIETLLKDPELKIDPKRVFITGLSSGAGEAMTLACLAPELIAGVGIVAAPMLGTTASQLTSLPHPPKEGGEVAKKLCESLAGEHRDQLKTQVASVVYAENDLVVNPLYGELNQEFYRALYALEGETSKDLSTLSGDRPKGQWRVFSDSKGPRLSVIKHQSIGHRWPSGQGGGNVKYIARASVDYPAHVLEFFLQNGRR